jgi:hypothetical protein
VNAEGIDFEIEERNRGSTIMGRLRGGVDDKVRPHLLHHAKHSLAIADVHGCVAVVGDFMAKTLQSPTCIALRAKEYSADCSRSQSRAILDERRNPILWNR